MENRQNNLKNYIPVSCDVIDQIEILATQKNRVLVQVKFSKSSFHFSGIIKTWFTKDKVEYLQFRGGTYIRLDKVYQIDNILVKDNSCKV